MGILTPEGAGENERVECPSFWQSTPATGVCAFMLGRLARPNSQF